MRVPNDKAPLVSVGTGGTAAGAARQYGLSLGAPMQPGTNAVGAFSRGFSDLKPITDGLQQVAQATSGIIQKTLQEQAETEALEAYAKAGGDLNSFLHGEGGIYSRKGVSAYNSVADTSTFFDSTGERYTKGMTTDAARKIFSERFAQLRYGTQSEVSKYEGGQRREALFNQRTAAMALDTETAMSNPYNDRIFNESWGRVRQDAQAQARMNGMSPEEEQLYLQKVDSQFLAGRAEKFLEAKDYNAAWAMLNDSRVSAADKTKLTAAYNESVVAEAQATAKADPQAAAQLLALSRERLAGMPEKEGGGVSSGIASLSQDAINRGVTYQWNSKDSSTGGIDCSGHVMEVGAKVYSPEAQKVMRRGASGSGAAGIIEAVGKNTGKVWQDDELAPGNVREGMLIGLDTGPGRGNYDKDRYQGIDHIAMTFIDPDTGKMMVSESTSGGRGGKGGVTVSSYEDWYRRQSETPGRGGEARRLFGVDPTAIGGTSGTGLAQTSAPSPDDPYSSLGKPQWVAIQTTAEAALKEHQRLADAAQVEAVYGELNAQLNSFKDATPEERDSIATGYLESIEDPDIRSKATTRWRADRAVYEVHRRAEDMRLGREFDKTVQAEGWSPGEALDKIELVEGMSEEGRERCRKKYSGQLKQTTPENRRAADALMIAIDKGEITTQPELDASVLKHGLTEKQAAHAEAYLNSGGNKEALSYSRVKSVYKSLAGKDLKDPDFFELVQKALPPGKAPDEAVVRKTIANMIMSGERESSDWGSFGYGRDMTYAEALKQGPDVAATWLPDISNMSKAEQQEIINSLRKAGFQGKITEQRIREEKRRQMGLPPLAKKEER